MPDQIKAALEGLLFLVGDEGLSTAQLADVMETSEETVDKWMDELIKEYVEDDSRGIEIVHFGGLYKFVSKHQVHEYAEKLFASVKMATLSQAALETLAIVAYKQPITRNEIEEIRGVGCDMMIRKLLARSLIKECGRSDAPGRPFLYEVTPEFMDSFQLESLKELPELNETNTNIDGDLFNEEA